MNENLIVERRREVATDNRIRKKQGDNRNVK